MQTPRSSPAPADPAAPIAGRKSKRTPARKSRASPPAHGNLPDDGAALFLGWEGTEHAPTLGFK
ncbi:MAG TPA: hypothetical protein VLM40_10425, partial [Gemmata sp.]|nr:hypothetical protein [Gemmata sp.]